uniref:Uncharacterized protein n=1 Tax=viral metagenome TaxID=1070528 RepID=A0A2V0RAN9_9ZZZZ
MVRKSLNLQVLNDEFLVSLFNDNYNSYMCSNVLDTFVGRRSILELHERLTGVNLKVTAGVLIHRPTIDPLLRSSTREFMGMVLENLSWIASVPQQSNEQHKIYAKLAQEQIRVINNLNIQGKERYMTALIVCFKLQVDIKKNFVQCENHTKALRELFDVDATQVYNQFSNIQNHTNMIELLLVCYIKSMSSKIENIDQCQLYANHIVQTRAEHVKYVSKVNETTLWAMTAYLRDAKKWFISPYSTSKANAHMFIVLDYFNYKLELPTISRKSVGDIMTHSTAFDKSYFQSKLMKYNLKRAVDMDNDGIASICELACRGGTFKVSNERRIAYLIFVTGAAYNDTDPRFEMIRELNSGTERFAENVREFFNINMDGFDCTVGRCLVGKLVDLYNNRLYRKQKGIDALMKDVVVNDPPLESDIRSTRIRNASRLLAIIRDAGISLKAHDYTDITLIIHSYREINSTEIMYVLSMCGVSVAIVGSDQILMYDKYSGEVKTVGRETEYMKDAYKEIYNYFGESKEDSSLTIHFYVMTTNKAQYSKSDTLSLIDLVAEYTDEIDEYTLISDMNYNVIEIVLPDMCCHMADPMKQWNDKGNRCRKGNVNSELHCYMTYQDIGVTDERMCCDKVRHAVNSVMELLDSGLCYLMKSGVQHGHNMAMLVVGRCSGFDNVEDPGLIRRQNETTTIGTLYESVVYDRMRNVRWNRNISDSQDEIDLIGEVIRDLRNKFKRQVMGFSIDKVEEDIRKSVEKLEVLSHNNNRKGKFSALR